MDLGKIQYFIARLTIDHSLLERFQTNSDILLKEQGFSQEEILYLNSIDRESFNTYKEVVNGTREHRFKELFPLLSNHFSEEWSELFDNFHKDTVITSTKNDNDLKMFIEYLNTKYPKSLISNLGLYEYLLYSFNSNAQHSHSLKEDEVVIAPDTKILELDFNLDELLESLNKDEKSLKKDQYLYIFKKDDEEVDIFEVDSKLFNLLKNSHLPTNIDTLSQELKMSLEELNEIINELVDNNILLRGHHDKQYI